MRKMPNRCTQQLTVVQLFRQAQGISIPNDKLGRVRKPFLLNRLCPVYADLGPNLHRSKRELSTNIPLTNPYSKAISHWLEKPLKAPLLLRRLEGYHSSRPTPDPADLRFQGCG